MLARICCGDVANSLQCFCSGHLALSRCMICITRTEASNLSNKPFYAGRFL